MESEGTGAGMTEVELLFVHMSTPPTVWASAPVAAWLVVGAEVNAVVAGTTVSVCTTCSPVEGSVVGAWLVIASGSVTLIARWRFLWERRRLRLRLGERRPRLNECSSSLLSLSSEEAAPWGSNSVASIAPSAIVEVMVVVVVEELDKEEEGFDAVALSPPF